MITRIHAGNYAHDNSPSALAVRRLRRIADWLRDEPAPSRAVADDWHAMIGAVVCGLALAQHVHKKTKGVL